MKSRKSMFFFYQALIFLSMSNLSNAQVGMGIESPRGILDLNSNNGTSVFGLVLPATNNVLNIKTPQGDLPVNGTIIYDSVKDCIRYYKTHEGVSQWSECLADKVIIKPKQP